MFEQVITKKVRILTLSAANGDAYAKSDVSDSKGFVFVEKDGKLRLGVFPGLDPEYGRKNLKEEMRATLDRSDFQGSFQLAGKEPRDHIDDLSFILSSLTSHSSDDVRGVAGNLQFIQDTTRYTNSCGAEVEQETWNALLFLRVYFGESGTRPYTWRAGAAGGHEAFLKLLKGKTLPPVEAEWMREGRLAELLVQRVLAMEEGQRLREKLPIVLEGSAAALVLGRAVGSQLGFDEPSLERETGPLQISLKSEAEFDGTDCCGSYRYDDEGVPHDSHLSDLYSRSGAAEHGTSPTGNFRVSPTTDSGKLVLPHVFCSPGDGFDLPPHALRIRSLYATGGSDQIVLHPAEASVDGRPVKEFSIATHPRELFSSIAGVGDQSTLGCSVVSRGHNVFGCDVSPSLLLRPFGLGADYIR